MDALRRLYAGMNKPTLVSILAVLTALAGERAWAWRQGVDAHITAAADGYQRLGAVERGQEQLRQESRELRDELRQLRMDQLSFYRSWAEDRGYREAQRHYEQRLRELREKP